MRGIAQQNHSSSLKSIDNGLRCKLFFLSKGSEVFVQQAAQGGILRKKRCRHGVCLAGCDAGRKKSHTQQSIVVAAASLRQCELRQVHRVWVCPTLSHRTLRPTAPLALVA